MTETFLVALPPGFGKTRLVWKKILPATAKWRVRLAQTCVIVPNRRTKMPWLRELLLYALERRPDYVPHVKNEKQIRNKASPDSLRKCFRGHKLKALRIITYGELKRMSPRALVRYKYVVFDEWHRLPWWFVDKCRASAGRGERLYPGASLIFLVSATPVNPVLEEDDDKALETNATTEPMDDENVACREREAVGKCLAVAGGLLGRRLSDDKGPYLDILRSNGVKPLLAAPHHRPWRQPTPCAIWPDSLHGVHEQRELLRFLGSDSPGFVDEYVWAVGLVATKAYSARGGYNLAQRRGRSFGHEYCITHLPKSRTRNAVKWLATQHTRVLRLLALLEEQGVVERLRRDGSWGLTERKKVLIFCIHRGVAAGLSHALKYLLTQHVDSIVDVSHDKKPDKMIVDFNKPHKPPFVLIATDAFSESIDLHYDCKLLVHYELPWSPLRLYQRIGRLARRIGSDYNAVTSAHVIVPGSVEEERVNRLIRRTEFLSKQKLLPGSGADYYRNGGVKFDHSRCIRFTRGLLGGGHSLHLREWIEKQR